MSEIVGIDVSKNNLDFHFLPSAKAFQVSNEVESLEKRLAELTGAQCIALESTGGYERMAVETLQKAGFNVKVINPKRVRDFARASGRLAKTDKIDAQIIAEFARTMPERVNHDSPVVSDTRQRLKDLNARRQDLVKMTTMEKNRKQQSKEASVTKSIDALLEALNKELKSLETLMKACVKEDKILKAQAKMLRKVKGVGPVLVWTLLSELPELGYINRKQLASLVGIVPFNRDSGKYRGKSQIWGGRYTVRKALYLAANIARQYDPTMKAFYEQLIHRGKPFKVALIACTRKLLTQLNAKMQEHLQEFSKTTS